jgi:hypothetical protein
MPSQKILKPSDPQLRIFSSWISSQSRQLKVGAMAITSRWSLQRATKSFWDVLSQGWYLGFTAFGGPPVHFKIVRISISH